MIGLIRRYGFAAAVAFGLAAMTAVVFGKSAFDAFTEAGATSARGGGGGPPGSGPPRGPGGGMGAAVVAAPAELHVFSDAIQAIGTAQARESVVLTPKVADTIRALRFDSGDRVRRGQVLVEMSSVEQAAGLEEARAADQAAEDELRRYQELFDRGFASQARLDAVQAAADAAQARLNANTSRIADRTIRAPFAGLVGLRTASPGQYVRPGEQIGTLDDIAEIKLDFAVPETQLARLAPGADIVARSGAFPERTFLGRIANIDSRVDTTTRTVRVRAILPNADEALRPGMLLSVEVRTNPREALAVPEIAVMDEGDSAFVYRVAVGENGARAERAPVRVGQRSGGWAEIVEGLAANDRVITEGVQSVRPGQPIRIAGEPGAEPQRQPRRS